jgi:hypothetical protein
MATSPPGIILVGIDGPDDAVPESSTDTSRQASAEEFIGARPIKEVNATE